MMEVEVVEVRVLGDLDYQQVENGIGCSEGNGYGCGLGIEDEEALGGRGFGNGSAVGGGDSLGDGEYWGEDLTVGNGCGDCYGGGHGGGNMVNGWRPGPILSRMSWIR